MNRGHVDSALSDISNYFSKLLLTTNHCSNQNSISWHHYDEGIFKHIPYAAEYQRLLDRAQYSFLINDSSFFQFYYEWNDKGELTKSKLSYYPTPVKIKGTIDALLEIAEQSGIDLMEELYFGAEGWLKRGIDVVNTSSIRLDYDSSVTSHSPCHFQVSSVNEVRISSEYLLNPFNFFNWIASQLNLDEYQNCSNSNKFEKAQFYHNTRCYKIPNFSESGLYITVPNNN